MPVKVQCDSCKKPMKAPDHLAGKRARCKCGAVLVIPEVQAEILPVELGLEAGFEAASPPASAPGPKPVAPSTRRSGHACSNCQADLPKGAVLCTNCGMYLRSGQRLSVSAGGPTKEPAPSVQVGRAAAKRKKSSGDAGAAALGVFFKLLKWVVVLGAVGAIAYGVRQAVSFDPRQQAKDALANIKPGMTVQEVVDAIAQRPHEVHVLIFEDQPGQPFPKPIDKKIGYQDGFMKNVDPKLIENGITFVFRYAQRDLLTVEFDPEGKVVNAEIVDQMKMLGM